jgi:hypothetical protein
MFTAQIDPNGLLRPDFPGQMVAYCKKAYAGQCVDVWIAPAGHLKSRLQEKGFHAMIQPWARSEGHQIDDLKRDLLRAIFGEREHTNPITGEIVMVLREPHTSKLSRAKYSELIERTLEIAAECGVILVAPNEWIAHQKRAKR